MASVLVDTGVWYSLCDKGDTAASQAVISDLYDRIMVHSLIVPWPVAYETLRSSFVKNRIALARFEREMKSPRVVFIDDAPYRKDAFDLALDSSLHRNRPLSMVDCVMRLLMDDTGLKVNYLATFNLRDFLDVCKNRRIEIWPHSNTTPGF